MHFIKQLFEGKPEDWVHLMFTRYGRGEFMGPVAEVDVGKDIKFKASVEYCGLFSLLAVSCGGDFKVEGGIYGKQDFRGVLVKLGVEFDDKSKPKQGVYVAQVEGDYAGDVIVKLIDGVPEATVLLNLVGSTAKLKCKMKPPKPGGEKVVDFCSGSLNPSVIGRLTEEIFFDAPKFAKAKVENMFVIDELVMPPGASPAEARLSAKRKGKVVRTVTVDGVQKKSECVLLV